LFIFLKFPAVVIRRTFSADVDVFFLQTSVFSARQVGRCLMFFHSSNDTPSVKKTFNSSVTVDNNTKILTKTQAEDIYFAIKTWSFRPGQRHLAMLMALVT